MLFAHDPTPIPPYFGVFPLDQIAAVGVHLGSNLKLFGSEIIFEIFQRVRSLSTIVTDGRTDDMQSQYRALHYSASRSN